MSTDLLIRHWALTAASVLALALALFVAWRVWLDSSPGRLAAARREYARRRGELVRTRRRVERCTNRLSRLQSRAERVKPRVVQEASEDLEDAKALQKIAQDQVLVAANLLRKIIVEEYPPRRHDSLRRRYLGDDGPDGRPFSF